MNKSVSFIYIISWWWNSFFRKNSILSKYRKYFCSLCKTHNQILTEAYLTLMHMSTTDDSNDNLVSESWPGKYSFLIYIRRWPCPPGSIQQVTNQGMWSSELYNTTQIQQIHTFPFHCRHNTPLPQRATRAPAKPIQKVGCQHSTPLHTLPWPVLVWPADTNA